VQPAVRLKTKHSNEMLLIITEFNLVGVDRHHGRLIFLEYTGEGEINTTALFVGKGITFDTGGLDIKGR